MASTKLWQWLTGLTEKSLDGSEEVYLNDSGVSKKTTTQDIANLNSVNGDIHAATSKTTPVDADELGLVDSAASWVLKKLTWANLKTTLSSVFAVLAGKSGGQTLIGGTGVTDKLVLKGTSGNGTSTATAFEVKVGNNGATNAITVLNNGNIGIGTTSPEALLDVVGGTGIKINYGSVNNRGLTIAPSWTSATDNGAVLTAYGVSGPSGNGTFRFNNISGNLVTIDSNGNTGFSNTSPSARIHATSTTEQLRLGYDASKYLSVTVDSDGDTLLKSTSNKIRLSDTARTPASASASGKVGEVCWDSSYLYVCTATDTWKRAAIATW